MGDRNLDRIYLSFKANLARAVSRIVPPKEIEDIVQETYVRVCQAQDPAAIRHPRSFLLRTARNLALDHVKRAESRLSVSLQSDEELVFNPNLEDETFERIASKEEFARFCDAVRRLPLQSRRVFVMKKVYGYTQKEIARRLNLSESTVEKHVALGIRRCTSHMMQVAESPANAHASEEQRSVRERGL